ncbi:hypothetical protein FMM56_00625 [Campylobacter sp. LR264d]|uniref:hypothetical protein n=1 Tax=unclassified Campylobacter TaxID=2593542 RepID=UPI001237BCC3|nr:MULTISPECIES: hypothetical protein [unclassified Campylobacter]KAA6226978.1 hypothetical protein FMM54_03515 [Campylobacter sp. LR185c]KAA6234555.1 hypothetical protein FMM56_00625 [Campylobacter sp. LR264d]KAA8604054.1 hypothetical protein CGP82_03840 [Campylobacter sp. LR185c]
MEVNTYSNVVSTTVSSTSVSNNTKADEESSSSSSSTTSSTDLSSMSIDELKELGGKGITETYLMQYMQISFTSTYSNSSAQSGIEGLLNADYSSKAASILSSIDFVAIGYTGTNPLNMSTDELNALLSEDGFFGVTNTANRIANFIISAAGDDLNKLQEGLKGMQQGFAQAEATWGGSLPDISQQTMALALELVTERINELGGNSVDLEA